MVACCRKCNQARGDTCLVTWYFDESREVVDPSRVVELSELAGALQPFEIEIIDLSHSASASDNGVRLKSLLQQKERT